MPLQKQTLALSFAQGLDTKTDQKQVMPGKMLTLENAIFTESLSFSKRNGYAAFTTATIDPTYSINPIIHGTYIANSKDALALGDSLNLYTFSETENKWYSRGTVETCGISSLPISSSPLAPVHLTSSINSQGLRMYAWVDKLGLAGDPYRLRVSILDPVPNSIILSEFTGYAVTDNPRALRSINIGTSFIIFYRDGPTEQLFYQVVDPTNLYAPAAPVNLGLTALAGGYERFELTRSASGNDTYLIYNASNGGGDSVNITRLNTTTTAITVTTTVVVPTDVDCIALNINREPSTNNVWGTYWNGADTRYTIYTAALAPVLAPATVETTPENINTTTQFKAAVGYILYDWIPAVTPGRAWNAITRMASATVLGVVTLSTIIPTVMLASEAFLYTSLANNTPEIHVMVNYGSRATGRTVESLQPTFFLLRVQPALNNFVVVGKILPSNAFEAGGGTPATGGDVSLKPINIISSSSFEMPIFKRTSTFLQGGTDDQLPRLIVASTLFDFTFKPQSLDLANNLHLSGSQLNMYDGASAVEQNFHLFPENIELGAITQPPGALIGVGTYEYTATYEWVDAFGQVHQSTPAIPLSVVVGIANSQVQVRIPALYMTNKVNQTFPVNVVLWRTPANQQTFFRVNTTRVQPATEALPVVVIGDLLSDAQIEDNPQLYTTGGEVENTSPPSSYAMASFKNRIILVPSEDRLSWWYSKQIIEDVPVEFSELFVQSIDQRGGDINAVSAMDDKICFFKDSVIFYVVGDGPSPNGTNNDFSYPQIISTDVGCIDRDSVVLTPMGLMFKSHKGIYLLDRGLTTSYIGAEVEDFNSFSITSARVVPSTTQVRFSLSNGTDLVFDYFYNQWSVFTNISAVDAIIYKNNYTYLGSNGVSQTETPGLFTDNGTAISLKLVTGWLSGAKIEGYQRLWRFIFLGQYKSPHTLTVQEAYDFDPTIFQTDVITGNPSNTPEQYRIHLKRQKCTSLQITIFDTPTAPLGEGLTLSGFSMDAGIKTGINKLPAAQSYG